MEAVRQWQGRINADFPRGLVMTWEGEEDSPVYRVPDVTVLSAVDGDPVVSFETIEEKGFADRITGYEVQRDKPKVVRVTFQNARQVALWSSNVSDDLAGVFQAVREDRA